MAPSNEDVAQNVRRDRWLNRPIFVLAAVGSSIGLGNFWKFPYLTFKHGGWMFILAYAVALFICGIPMLILELTLGQKMQRGSAGALRGITPRLAGAGWAASIAGFFVCMVYNILIGLSLVYMVSGNAQPWSKSTYDRTDGCNTATMKATTTSELYFYKDVVKLFDDEACAAFEYGDGTIFSWGLYLAVLITWLVCFLCIMFGVKSSSYVVMVTVPLPFICLFALMAYFIGLNNDAGGDGIAYYLGGKQFPIGTLADGEVAYYDPRLARGDIIQDAYLMVLYSVGIGHGIFFAYGSYNHIRKPVIMDAMIIGILDFVFSILAGFCAWGAIGYLQVKGSSAANQTSSVGLGFIAFAEATSLDEDTKGKGWFVFLMFTLFVASIDSSFSYIEAVVTNIVDEFKANRTGSAFFVCFTGAVLSLFFTSNFGWVLFDIVDHYISSYIVLGAALMQCVSVGWCFERDSTARMSPEHAKSLKWLSLMYWFPMVTISFYANFAFAERYEIGIIIIMVTSFLSLFVSYFVVRNKFKSISWYHEIMLCGVDKLSMSITSLSNDKNGDGESNDDERQAWMIVFEGYFGIMIKYVNPACLTFMIMMNLSEDLVNPYAEQPPVMQMYGTIFVYIIMIMFIGSLFMCDYPEKFWHDVNKEFDADNQYAAKLRGLKKAKTQKLNSQNVVGEEIPESKAVVEAELAEIEEIKS